MNDLRFVPDPPREGESAQVEAPHANEVTFHDFDTGETHRIETVDGIATIPASLLTAGHFIVVADSDDSLRTIDAIVAPPTL